MGKSGKSADIQVLKASFEADQARQPMSEREEWTGSLQQVYVLALRKKSGPLV